MPRGTEGPEAGTEGFDALGGVGLIVRDLNKTGNSLTLTLSKPMLEHLGFDYAKVKSEGRRPKIVIEPCQNGHLLIRAAAIGDNFLMLENSVIRQMNVSVVEDLEASSSDPPDPE